MLALGILSAHDSRPRVGQRADTYCCKPLLRACYALTICNANTDFFFFGCCVLPPVAQRLVVVVVILQKFFVSPFP